MIRPFCERSGACESVDLAATPGWWYGRYPGLLNAQIDLRKVQRLDAAALRRKHLRIRTIERFLDGCGFFTFPLMVMNQLWVAHRFGLIGDDDVHDKKPFVYLPERHHYFDPPDDCGGDDRLRLANDFWEKWFEPISNVSWHEVDEDDVWEFSQASLETMYYDPDGIHAYPYNNRHDDGSPSWIAEQRHRALEVMNIFHIQVQQSHLNESMTQFVDLFGARDHQHQPPVIGLHMRGTDKFVTGKVDVAEYDIQVDRFLDRNNNNINARIFLATDDEEYLQHMTRRYGRDQLRHLNVMREAGNVLYNDRVDKDAKCRDALLDMLALSYVDTLVKGWSAVSEFAVYFRQARNEERPLSIVDLQLFDGGSTHPRTARDQKIVDALHKGAKGDVELGRSRYLPKSLEGHSLLMDDAQFQRLQAEIDALTAEECRGDTLQLHVIEWGLGSALNSLVKPVQHALKNGYCMNEPIGWKKFNCSGGWGSLFAPFSEPRVVGQHIDETFNKRHLSVELVDTSECSRVFNMSTDYNHQYGFPELFFTKEYRACSKQYSFAEHGVDMLPASHRSIGHFASVALILSYLYRPSPILERLIHEHKAQMDWPTDNGTTPVLGIHYRSGDSCLEMTFVFGRRCDPFDVYMAEADILQEKYGFQHIFLATDSDSVLAQLDDYPNWTFHYIRDIDRGGVRNSQSIDKLLVDGTVDGCREATESFLDTYILGQCDAFIGKFSSNMDRIAYAFMFARFRHHVPHISLDTNWCFDYGVRSRPGLASSWLSFDTFGSAYYC